MANERVGFEVLPIPSGDLHTLGLEDEHTDIWGRSLDIRQLRHFMGVASHGGFSKASRLMHISQPALTRSVQMLEDRLKAKLFDRSYQGIELTENGHILFRYASLILNSLEAAESELAAVRTGVFAEVHIGLANLFTNMLVDTAITELVRENDHVTVDVRVGLYEDLAELLLEGALDIIVSTNSETENAQDIVFEPLCEITAVLVVGANHPLTNESDVTLASLKEQAWVTLNQPHMEVFLASFFAQDGITAPKRRVKTSSLEMIRSLLRKQCFIGILPSHWVAEDIKQGRLATLDVAGMPVRRTAGMVTRKAPHINPAVGMLMDQLRVAASELPGPG